MKQYKTGHKSWLSIRILTIGGSALVKTGLLFYLINQKLYTNKINLYAKKPYEAKYQFLINNCKGEDLKNCNDDKAFTEYSIYMDDIYENNKECNTNKKSKILIVFDETVIGMVSNKKSKSNWTIY